MQVLPCLINRKARVNISYLPFPSQYFSQKRVWHRVCKRLSRCKPLVIRPKRVFTCTWEGQIPALVWWVWSQTRIARLMGGCAGLSDLRTRYISLIFRWPGSRCIPPSCLHTVCCVWYQPVGSRAKYFWKERDRRNADSEYTNSMPSTKLIRCCCWCSFGYYLAKSPPSGGEVAWLHP